MHSDLKKFQQDLLESVRHMKRGEAARVTQVQLPAAAQARAQVGLSQQTLLTSVPHGMDAHNKRLRNWSNLAPAKTRLLVDSLLLNMTSALEGEGFRRVDHNLGESVWPVSGSEIVYERWGPELIDSITVNFDKYRRPRFQVHCSRRHIEGPHGFVRAANLVRARSQYFHFWGKPWWLPIRLWRVGSALRTVESVVGHLKQLISFLESGERGKNISKPV